MIHALGPFRLDTRDGVLLHGKEPVALGRRAIALLRALVEKPGALLSKVALIEAAWSCQSVEDSDLTVSDCGVAPRARRDPRRRGLDRNHARSRLSIRRAGRDGGKERRAR